MAAIDLRVGARTLDPWVVVDVEGEIDMLTAPRLREALVEQIEAGRHRIVVNMLRVSFMDSTGLGTLVGALKRLKEHGGTLALVCGNRAVLRVLSITGLDNVFPIHASVEEAVAAG